MLRCGSRRHAISSADLDRRLKGGWMRREAVWWDPPSRSSSEVLTTWRCWFEGAQGLLRNLHRSRSPRKQPSRIRCAQLAQFSGDSPGQGPRRPGVNVNGFSARPFAVVFRDLGEACLPRAWPKHGKHQSNIPHSQNSNGLRFKGPGRPTEVNNLQDWVINTGDIRRRIAVCAGCDDDRIVVKHASHRRRGNVLKKDEYLRCRI